MSKYLDNNGVLYFWQKIKATFAKISHTHTTADVTGLDTALADANKVTDVKVNGSSVVTNKSANITVDSTLSTTSNNPIKNSTVATKFNSVDSAISGKQNKLTFDSTPKSDSSNPVTSGGIYEALLGKQDTLVFDTTSTPNSKNPVTSGGVFSDIAAIFGDLRNSTDTKLGTKQDKILNADKLSIDSSGIIATKNLPSYVDDVVEVYVNLSNSDTGGKWLAERNSETYDSGNFSLKFSPETGKIYVVIGGVTLASPNVGTEADAGEYQNTQWRWTGSQYVRLTDGSGMSPISNSEIDAIVAQ